MSFCAENVYLGVSFKLQEIFGLFVQVHLQNYGLAFLISSTEKMEVTHATETENPATYHIVRFVALINYYAVNFATEKHF